MNIDPDGRIDAGFCSTKSKSWLSDTSSLQLYQCVVSVRFVLLSICKLILTYFTNNRKLACLFVNSFSVQNSAEFSCKFCMHVVFCMYVVFSVTESEKLGSVFENTHWSLYVFWICFTFINLYYKFYYHYNLFKYVF